MSKQAAVKIAIQELHRAGVSLAKIKSVTHGEPIVAVHPAAGQTAKDAFRHKYHPEARATSGTTSASPEDNTTWVIPRFGGRHTEQILDGLAGARLTRTGMVSQRSIIRR